MVKGERMKPVIIYCQPNDDGTVTVTKDELERFFNEAYEAGKREGNPWHITTVPHTVPLGKNTEITCEVGE